MAQIPLSTRTQVGPGRVGAVKPPLSLADRSGEIGLARTVAATSGDLFRKMTATTAANEEAAFRGEVNTELQAYNAFVDQNPNASIEDLQKEQQSMMGRIRTAGGEATTGIGRRNNTNWLAANESLINQKAQDQMVAIKTNQELTKYQINQKANMEALDGDAYKADKERMVETGLLNKEIAVAQEERDMAIIDRAMDKIEVDNVKPLLINAMGDDLDKQAGLATLNSELDRLVKDGVLTEAEAAEQNKVLGDWMDNFVSGREKKAKNIIKLTTLEQYTKMVEPIISGELTFDDIEDNPNLLEDDEDKWKQYVTGSYKDAPTVTTPQGFKDSTGAVFDIIRLETSSKEAYDELLTLRFIEHSITDEQYQWGLDKIENPYPKDIMEDLQSTMNSNDTEFNRFFKRDAQRNTDVNLALISWVDGLIEKDAVPAFDFKKKMFAMSSQFRVGDDRLADIGDTILRNGEEWEVVGFYEDGEPSWEKVE